MSVRGRWWHPPPSEKPIPAADGPSTGSAPGPVARSRWSPRFIGMLESFGMGGRLQRGRAYARAGQVLSMTISTSVVVAQVRGSRSEPYKVRVGLRAFTRAQWATVETELARQARYAAALLSGEPPEGVEEVFETVGLRLLPEDSREMTMDCACPDWAVPCEHLAAVFYLLAESFDSDPLTLFAWRGRGRDELLTRLRELRAAEHAQRRREPVEPAVTDLLDTFWTAPPPVTGTGDHVPTPLAALAPDAVLDQLGPSGIIVDGRDLTEALRPVYRMLGS